MWPNDNGVGIFPWGRDYRKSKVDNRLLIWENIRMNNLTDLREQLQEDMIAYFDGYDFGLNIDEVCQIIVDRVTELQDNLEDE